MLRATRSRWRPKHAFLRAPTVSTRLRKTWARAGVLESYYVAHHGVDGTLVGSQACGPDELTHGPTVACGGELFFGSGQRAAEDIIIVK